MGLAKASGQPQVIFQGGLFSVLFKNTLLFKIPTKRILKNIIYFLYIFYHSEFFIISLKVNFLLIKYSKYEIFYMSK